MLHRFGTFEFGADSGELYKNGRAVALEPQPAKALALLLSKGGQIVSREELRDVVWERTRTSPSIAALPIASLKIRTALGDSARHLGDGRSRMGAGAAPAVRDRRRGCVSATGSIARQGRGWRLARQLRARSRAGREATGEGAGVDRLRLWRLGNLPRCGRPCRQPADCGFPAQPRSETDHLFGDDGPARRRQSVRRGASRHS